MLIKTLSEVRRYVPSYWALQSFIATNPLSGLTSKPFIDSLKNLAKYVKINGALSIDLYHRYFSEGKISLASLSYAIREFMVDKLIFNEKDHKILVSTLIDPSIQFELEKYFKNNFLYKSILVSDSIEQDNNYFESKKVFIRVSKFIADFFDLGQAQWNMPVKSKNLYQAWLEYCCIEENSIKNSIKYLSKNNSEEAILYLVNKLGIPDNLLEQYLIEISFRIIGWSSFIKWIEERPDNPYITLSAKLSDIFAMWLSLEYALSLKFGIKFDKSDSQTEENKNFVPKIFLNTLSSKSELYTIIDRYSIHLIWQRALEKEYQDTILNKIKSNIANNKHKFLPSTSTSKAQLVFCIDTRSEGIRSKLEFIGDYETFGFAGFFGVGFRLKDEESNSCTLQCPVIVSPESVIINKKSQQNRLDILKNNIFKVFKNAKNAFLSPLVLFDIVGMYFSISLILKTLFPNRMHNLLRNKSDMKFSSQTIDIFDGNEGFTRETIASKVSFVLKAIGLVDNFAPFVILTGHIAQSENNPFQSSLDCGACGGNGGIPNAIAFCQALNDSQVREILKAKYKINIPKHSFFVSSCHNTTTDKFSYYNLVQLNQTQKELFENIIDDIDKACDLLRSERLSSLSGDKNVHIRKSNWAELIPEMGLANNAAFIIAPRKLTKDINLERRVFLHSYEPELDEYGDILSFIFNAPVIVGHWINSQYYFSTTDKHIFGAGNKAIHNVIGQFGVMEGNFSDYKIGLPEQSIMYRQQLVHQPLRLTVFVCAKAELIEKTLEQSQQLRELFNGRWMHLEVLDTNF
ncbi:MAG: putative inorganic carbon transporter subunit DabA [Neisseriaceae bacterium]